MEDTQETRSAHATKLFQTGFMLIYGKRKSVDKAIKCIQKAITFNDADYRYWQLLGEAYYQRGSMNPSINCLMRSLNLAKETADTVDDGKLKQDCAYTKLRISDILMSVGQLDEAVRGYQEILVEDPNNIAALISLAKTELEKARNSFHGGLVKLGQAHCMSALKLSIKAIKLNSGLCLTWKLASDCCLVQFVQGQRSKFSVKVDEQFPADEQSFLIIDRQKCIELSQQFLCKALVMESQSCLWSNLGITLYLKSTIVPEKEQEALLRRSMKCLLKALKLDRTNSQIKNSIGVVAFKLNLLNTSQSLIIKSIQTNLSTSEIQFSNLGYIYMQKGEFKLADVAFRRGQAEEPLYARSWLGQALVREQENMENLSHLRHCHRLGNNYEAQLMFATKVASTSSVDEYKSDLSSALDCMQRIINYDDQSLVANTTLGLLYERCNQIEQAMIYYDKAYQLSPQDSRVIFNKLRLLSTTGCLKNAEQVAEAAEFIKSAEKLVNGGNKEYLLNYVYYLFNNGDYQRASTRMTKFVDKLPQSDIRHKISAQILFGLVARAEKTDFKSWFFKNIIDGEDMNSIESVVNLLCLMLSGSIEADQQLVEETSNDLSTRVLAYVASKRKSFDSILYSSDGSWIRMVLFSSIFCLPEKTCNKLIRRLLALFPTSAELWIYMGLSLLFLKNDQSLAIHCLKKATMISQTDPDLTTVCDLLLAILSSITTTKGIAKTQAHEQRITHLSRATFNCPSYGLLWSILLKSPASKAYEKSSRSSIDQSLDSENHSLFQLAIDHTLKTIIF